MTCLNSASQILFRHSNSGDLNWINEQYVPKSKKKKPLVYPRKIDSGHVFYGLYLVV